jgi:DNA-binding transcriptional ArsR family regulator
MPNPSQAKRDPALIDTPAQIRALASTLRQDIIDTLQALGQAAVPELARHLGLPADALYYHVRALLRAKLIRRVAERRRGRHLESVYATFAPDQQLKLRYKAGRSASTQALKALVSSMLRGAGRDFDAAIASSGCVVEGERRELWAGRVKGWVSPTDIERINQLLSELGTIFHHAADAERTQLLSLQFLLAPGHGDALAYAMPGQNEPPTRKRSPRRSP